MRQDHATRDEHAHVFQLQYMIRTPRPDPTTYSADYGEGSNVYRQLDITNKRAHPRNGEQVTK